MHGQSWSPTSSFDDNRYPAPPKIKRATPSTNPILAANLIHQFYSPILQPIHPHPQPSTPTHHAPRHRPHFLRWSLHRRQMPHLRRQSPKVSKSMLHLYFRTIVSPTPISSSPIPSLPRSDFKHFCSPLPRSSSAPAYPVPPHLPHLLYPCLHSRLLSTSSHLLFTNPVSPKFDFQTLSLCFTPIYFITTLSSTPSSTSPSLPLLASPPLIHAIPTPLSQSHPHPIPVLSLLPTRPFPLPIHVHLYLVGVNTNSSTPLSSTPSCTPPPSSLA